MNPLLKNLQPYPFQKLSKLLEGITADSTYTPIHLHIGEPKHETPAFILEALTNNLDGVANYPTTLGSKSLRTSIASWLVQRYQLTAIDPETEIIPVNGSREALFAFAQTIINRETSEQPVVVCSNPFYQIYEGAALLAGARPYFLNSQAEQDFTLNYQQLPETIWERTQLIYVCSPNNPTGRIMTLDEWRQLFELSDHYGFVIASDECYSEIYFNEQSPPLGGLQAAQQLGRNKFPRLVVFTSLSKRSNVPGLRSGFVAGDASILKDFLLYRTYHGSAMNPAVQAASAAAWSDEQHVIENRRIYYEKFNNALAILNDCMSVKMPDAGFYLWVKTPINDQDFTQNLYRDYNVIVLPGSYLGREAHGVNPGENFVRIALVASLAECTDAMKRIKECISSHLQ